MIRIVPDDPMVALAYGHRLTHHKDPAVRRHAAQRLGTFGAEAPGATPSLIHGVEDQDEKVAYEAITALGMIGPAAKDAIPTLEKLTEHNDPQIAERAKAAVRQIRGR